MQKEKEKKILVITACGNAKNNAPMQAWKLYKSSRIKAVYNRSREHEFCIISAKYGLIKADQIIEPYNEIMDKQKVDRFLSDIPKKLYNYDIIIYFRGGAGHLYCECVKESCRIAKKMLIVTGFANMGGINNFEKIFDLLKKNKLQAIKDLKYTHIFLNT